MNLRRGFLFLIAYCLLFLFSVVSFSTGQTLANVDFVYPNGGEQINVGTYLNITWTQTNVEKVTMWYKIPPSTALNQIVYNMNVNSNSFQSYNWYVPTLLGGQTIRLTMVGDGDFGSGNDETDGTFSIVSCEDQCSTSGTKQCSGNGYQTCGNHDSDSCLEWGSVTSCSANQACVAGNCLSTECSDTETIIKLSSLENAHAEMWNETNYYYRICFNKIFGYDYGIPANEVHLCNEDYANKIVGLSGLTNAHAEAPEYATYPESLSVCYADLACRSVDGSCAVDEKPVITMPQITNSHVGNSSYDIQICCKPLVKTSYWSDLNKSKINIVDLDDTVALVLNNSGRAPVKYELWKTDGILDDKILETTVVGPLNWRANAAGNYKFRATLGENEFDSDNLEVKTTRHNSPPFVKILKPKNGEFYFVNSPIEFIQISYDVDDEITSFWDLGNDDISEEYNFNYTYTSEGQKLILLKVTDSRGLYATDRADIHLLKDSSGVIVAPFIEYPSEGQAIVHSQLKVQYFGSNTSVINITYPPGQEACVSQAICVAGICPPIISNGPICNTSVKNITIVGTRGLGYDKLTYNWTFFNLDNQNNKISIVGSGEFVRSGEKTYSSRGPKIINLTVNYTHPSGTVYKGTASRHFTLMSGSYCSENRDYFYVVNNEGDVISQKPTATTDGCMGPDNVVGGIDCCPAGNICVVNHTSGEYGCRPATVDLGIKCEDYTTQDLCEDDLYNAVQNSPAYEIVKCGTTSVSACIERSKSCACTFKDSACKFTEIITEQNSLCGVIGPSTNLGGCTITTTESQCLNGYKTVELVKTAYGGISAEACQNEQVTIPCGRNVAALPFFGIQQLIIAVILIVIVYIIYFKLKKKKIKAIKGKKK